MIPFELSEIPLFPLPLVAFPGCRLPLQIFEPRYLDMVKFCMAKGRAFGVVTIDESGSSKGPYEPALLAVGTTVRIVDFHEQANGLLGIVCEGGQKFTFSNTRVAEDKLLLGSATILEEEPVEPVPFEFEDLVDLLQTLFEHPYVKVLGYPDHSDRDFWMACASRLSFYLAYLLPLPLEQRYTMLTYTDAGQRLAALQTFIDDVNGYDNH